MNLHTILTCLLFAMPAISMANPAANQRPDSQESASASKNPGYFSEAQKAIIEEHIQRTRNRAIWSSDTSAQNDAKENTQKAKAKLLSDPNPAFFNEYAGEYNARPTFTNHSESRPSTQKTNYAYRFAFLSDVSAIKKACSTIHENQKVNDACAVLSNFLYCMHHPYRPDRKDRPNAKNSAKIICPATNSSNEPCLSFKKSSI